MPLSRKHFIESVGATCINWTWSWSFVNEAKRFVIFGAWEVHTEGAASLILSKAWEFGGNGRRKAAYKHSLAHIRLIEDDGYRLFTFPMIGKVGGRGPSKIHHIIPELSERSLARYGDLWFACDDTGESVVLPCGASESRHFEGEPKSVHATRYERNRDARKQCIDHHGCYCGVCKMDFMSMYGELGDGYIEVHHIVSLSTTRARHQVDPIHDLVPICPNCHAMIHRRDPPLEVEELQALLRCPK